MTKRQELLVYSALILVAGSLSLLLVTSILQAKSERADYAKKEDFEVDSGAGSAGQLAPLDEAISVFKEQGSLFSPLVTPKPTDVPPTPVPPTPTPIPLLPPKWMVKNIIGKAVQLETGDKKTMTYKEGDTIPKFPPEAAAFQIYRVDKTKNRFFLVHKVDKVMGWIYKDGGQEYSTELPP